ncbi:nuclear transport factor 2 family protein [Celeribacter ethanolicus]|uniref:nuclear transport factor 2 family protein n=1 Tax=Celeribacter ethanolicus TaxID=1758178 RepID=UPI000830B706|nr:nuclear transport factor 2 family protein [Celeribacter ethanolicus]TNE66050.1 MAG: nuclear transport factor 2 family protein [Paracoccaceae bacterium]
MTDCPLIDAFYAAYNRHDAEAATRLYATEGRHDEIAMGKSRTGHEALRDGLTGFFNMLPDVTWTPHQTVRSADHIAVFYHMTGTFTPRPSDKAPDPAPKPVALDGMHLFQRAGDEIVRTQDYWDKDAFLAQIG